LTTITGICGLPDVVMFEQCGQIILLARNFAGMLRL
jgi:hypothetical protein